MSELSDEDRTALQGFFEQAETDGLDPEWFDDESGFSCLCPSHKGTEMEHRCEVRAIPNDSGLGQLMDALGLGVTKPDPGTPSAAFHEAEAMMTRANNMEMEDWVEMLQEAFPIPDAERAHDLPMSIIRLAMRPTFDVRVKVAIAFMAGRILERDCKREVDDDAGA